MTTPRDALLLLPVFAAGTGLGALFFVLSVLRFRRSAASMGS